jgi:hypothetical protein
MKIFLKIIVALAIILVLIQLIPVQRTNPPVKSEPAWDSDETRNYAKRLCFDCHSNETKWPWYSYIAPISWIIASHVSEGREEFNISEYKSGDGDEAAKMFIKGYMPLRGYAQLHPETKLTKKEREEFFKGLKATFGEK